MLRTRLSQISSYLFRSGRDFLVLTFTGWRYWSGQPIMDESGVGLFLISSLCIYNLTLPLGIISLSSLLKAFLIILESEAVPSYQSKTFVNLMSKSYAVNTFWVVYSFLPQYLSVLLLTLLHEYVSINSSYTILELKQSINSRIFYSY